MRVEISAILELDCIWEFRPAIEAGKIAFEDRKAAQICKLGRVKEKRKRTVL